MGRHLSLPVPPEMRAAADRALAESTSAPQLVRIYPHARCAEIRDNIDAAIVAAGLHPHYRKGHRP